MILDIVERDHLCDYELAHILNTSRPRASALIHGYVAEFNSETLIDILGRLGVTVDIAVTHTQRYARLNIANPRPGWKRIPGTVYG